MTFFPLRSPGFRSPILPRAERNRLLLVRLITWIYWLLIFEGAIRKWLLPNYQKLLFFLKDPLVLLAYLLAARIEFWSRPSPMLLLAAPLALIGALIGIFGILQDQSPIMILYSWRNYFLYIPLAFLCERVLSAKEIEAIAKRTLFLSVLVAPLCLLQAHAPASSPLNAGLGEGENAFENLGVYGEIERASGTFSSSIGQSLFVGSCVAFLLSFWLRRPSERPIGPTAVWVVTLGVLVNLLLSGSRSAYLGAAVSVCAGLAAFASAGQLRRAIGTLMALVVAVGISGVLAAVAFPDVIEAMATRWTGANEGEGGFLMTSRIAYDMTQFWRVRDDTPLWGFGLGSASNAAGRLGMAELPYDAEADWTRHIAELGPVIGLFYMLYRFGLLAYLGVRSWKAARRLRSPLPMLLLSFIAPTLFYGLLTGQGTANGYGWLFVGFCFAASRLPKQAQLARDVGVRASPRSGGPDLQPGRINPRRCASS
ncbi:hypothetical protein MAMC_01137 [Methylacidimicrobium cyclopophantes]|uniref:O-antigen ligase n=1 Tax=Methylacidimicrobium cyclopophantes TaxID=1041766 RepID=A0A5E6MBH2_9BACT|nr:hypothetical protein [Methylacidimicrobium cyclopophantes]VVM06539.1 hypothetical protein MAMC_01137 [Methylacidimicrobium cyclopophantes]